MVHCGACHRSDTHRGYYCSQCLTKRLGEHLARKQTLDRQLALTIAKAIHLLQPSTTHSGWSVATERLLKAEKFSLALKGRDIKLAIDAIKQKNATVREKQESRKVALEKRRNDLMQARAILSMKRHDNLDADPFASTSQTTLERLKENEIELTRKLEAVRQERLRELSLVYAFTTKTRIQSDAITSPFLSTSPELTAIFFPSSNFYSLAKLALPKLSGLRNLPSTELSAVLSNLLHLTRLIGLSYSLVLPFTPLPALFGAGRPGVRATPDFGENVRGIAPNSPSHSANLPCWPLFLSRTKSDTSTTDTLSGSSDHVTAPQTGGIETASHRIEREKRENRLQIVLTGAVALIFNLAWIAWKRGYEISASEFDDIGKLLTKVCEPVPVKNRLKLAKKDSKDSILINFRPSSAKFPLDFSVLVARYAIPLSTLKSGKRGNADQSLDEDFVII